MFRSNNIYDGTAEEEIDEIPVGDFYDVDLDEMAVLSAHGGLFSRLLRGPLSYNTILEKNLCSTGASECIIIVALGNDKVGETVQGIVHITDVTVADTALEDLLQLMRLAGCNHPQLSMYGGNESTLDCRKKLLEQGIEIRDKQMNDSTEDGFYSSVYILSDQIKVLINNPDKIELEENDSLEKTPSNNNIADKQPIVTTENNNTIPNNGSRTNNKFDFSTQKKNTRERKRSAPPSPSEFDNSISNSSSEHSQSISIKSSYFNNSNRFFGSPRPLHSDFTDDNFIVKRPFNLIEDSQLDEQINPNINLRIAKDLHDGILADDNEFIENLLLEENIVKEQINLSTRINVNILLNQAKKYGCQNNLKSLLTNYDTQIPPQELFLSPIHLAIIFKREKILEELYDYMITGQPMNVCKLTVNTQKIDVVDLASALDNNGILKIVLSYELDYLNIDETLENLQERYEAICSIKSFLKNNGDPELAIKAIAEIKKNDDVAKHLASIPEPTTKKAQDQLENEIHVLRNAYTDLSLSTISIIAQPKKHR